MGMVRTPVSLVSVIFVALLPALCLNAAGFGQLSPPYPEAECTNSLLSLLNCEPFLHGDNNVSSPAESCCAGLSDLVRTVPTCLCGVISGDTIFASVNLTRASELPLECGIPIDESRCSEIGAPPPSPPTPTSDPPGLLDSRGSTGMKTLLVSMLSQWLVPLVGTAVLFTFSQC